MRVRTIVDEAGISDSLFFDSTGGSHAWDTERYLNIWVANTGKYLSGYGTYPALTPDSKTGVVDYDPPFPGLPSEIRRYTFALDSILKICPNGSFTILT